MLPQNLQPFTPEPNAKSAFEMHVMSEARYLWMFYNHERSEVVHQDLLGPTDVSCLTALSISYVSLQVPSSFSTKSSDSLSVASQACVYTGLESTLALLIQLLFCGCTEYLWQITFLYWLPPQFRTRCEMAEDTPSQRIASGYQALGLVFAIAAAVFLSKLVAVRRKTFELQRLGLVENAILEILPGLTRLRRCHQCILSSVIFLSATASCRGFPKMHILTISRIRSDEPCLTWGPSSIWMLGLFSLQHWLWLLLLLCTRLLRAIRSRSFPPSEAFSIPWPVELI